MLEKNKILILINIGLLIIGLFLLQQIYLQIKFNNLNIILISVDTLRPDHMGIYGYEKNTTPNIDKFFQTGLIFENLYSVAPYTRASFAALMTGQHLPTYTALFKNNQSITLAQELKQQGFYNVGFIDNEVLYQKNNPLIANGFDQYYDEVGYNEYTHQNQQDRLDNYKLLNYFFDYLTNSTVKQNFIWFHIMGPHHPYIPPEEYRCKFNSLYCNAITNLKPQQIKAFIDKNRGCHSQVSIEDNTIAQTLYDGEVNYMDDVFQLIINHLKKQNLLNKSIIILYGDHGDSFAHGYYNDHNSVVYSDTIKIPLLIYHPYFKGQKIDNNLSNIKIKEIVLKLLKITSQNKFDLLVDDIKQINEPIFSMNTFSELNKFSIIENNYHYIWSKSDSCLFNQQAEELYYLKNDPAEMTNLVLEKKQISQDLKHKLEFYISEVIRR